MERKLAGKSFIIIVAAVLLLALGIYAYIHSRPQSNLTARVNVNGETVMNIKLADITDAREYTLDNGIVIIAVNHTVAIKYSPCKDKICVNGGFLSRAGDTSACVPLRTAVVVTGGDAAVDVITN